MYLISLNPPLTILQYITYYHEFSSSRSNLSCFI